MKTVRDIVSKLEMDATFHKQHSNILIDQALKELEEVILESLPERIDELDIKTAVNKGVAPASYNQALEDTRKAIKELMK